MNKVIRYFDLASDARARRRAHGVGEGLAAPMRLHWLPQYVALVLGILAQRFMQQYMTSGNWNATGFWGWFLASLVIAVMAFPGVYKSSFDPEKPIFVQFCVIFAAGMGWQSLIGGALKGAGAT